MSAAQPRPTFELCAAMLCLTFAGVARGDQPQTYTVAGLCVKPEKWDKAHNFELLTRYARQAARQHAELIVTCEGFLEGYVANQSHSPGLTRNQQLEVAETLDGPYLRRIAALADELDVHLGIGFAELRVDELYNSFVVFGPDGKPVLRYSKTHSANEPFNTPGNRLDVAASGVGVLGALICYDRRFPEVARILTLKGAQTLLIPAHGTDGQRNIALLQTRAWENSVWVVYVRQNQVLIFKPNGRIAAQDDGSGEDQIVFARITLDDDVGGGDITNRRAAEFYRELVELNPLAK